MSLFKFKILVLFIKIVTKLLLLRPFGNNTETTNGQKQTKIVSKALFHRLNGISHKIMAWYDVIINRKVRILSLLKAE